DSTRLLLVRVGRWNPVGEAAGPLEHLAFIVGTVRDLVGCSEALHAILVEGRPARLREVAKGETRDAVALGAGILVDLEAALKLVLVEATEEAGKAPRLALDVDGFAGGVG